MRRALLGACVAGLLCAVPAVAFNPDTAVQVAVSPDSRFVYAASLVGTVTYQRDGGGGLTLLEDDEPPGGAIALAPDGRSAYVASPRLAGAPQVHVLSRDAADGRLTHEVSIDPGLTWLSSIVVSPDGRHVYVASRQAGAIVTYERVGTTSLREVGRVFGGSAPGEVPGMGQVTDLAMSPDGAYLYAGGGVPIVLRRDAASGALAYAGKGPDHGAGETVVVSPDGGRLYTGGAFAYARDRASGQLTALDHPSPGSGFGRSAVSPDSRLVLSANPSDSVLLLDRAVPAGAERVARWSPGLAPWYPAWSPDGRSAYVGAEHGRIGIWSRAGDALVPAGAAQAPLTRFPRWPVGASVTIDGGAEFTRSTDARLTIAVPSGVSALRISDRPDFAGAPARRVRDGGQYAWRLRDAGLGQGVRRVYVRYVTRHVEAYEGGGPAPVDVSDDIVLDQRPPTVVAGRLVAAKRARRKRGRSSVAARRAGRRSTLRLRARDNRSGVHRLQITTKRSRPGKARRYARRLSVRGQPRRVWVRVIDKAGNKSRWKAVRRR